MNVLCGLFGLGVALVVGYALGVYTTLRWVKHRTITAREVEVQVRDVRDWLEKVNRWITHWLAPLLLVVFLIAGYAVVQGSRNHSKDQSGIKAVVQQVQDQNDCLISFANRLYDSLSPRQKASEELQQADRRFKRVDQRFAESLSQLLTDARINHADQETLAHDAAVLQRTTEAKAKALAHANAVSNRLDRKRVQNPYPLPPKKVCPKS